MKDRGLQQIAGHRSEETESQKRVLRMSHLRLTASSSLHKPLPPTTTASSAALSTRYQADITTKQKKKDGNPLTTVSTTPSRFSSKYHLFLTKMPFLKDAKTFFRRCLPFPKLRSDQADPMNEAEDARTSMSTQDIQSEETYVPKVVGSYIMGKPIGSGSFGSVHFCHDKKDVEKKYAGKLFDLQFIREEEDNIDMIYSEVNILKALSHENTVSFVDLVFSRHGILLVMELVEGTDLYAVIPANVGIVESFARVIFVQLVNALKYLHGQRIVHRDIKIENVMINNLGKIKLVDYGLAEQVREELAKHKGLIVHGRCGTEHCYAPEIILSEDGNEEFAGDKLDIWAAGVFLYSIVSGTRPFRGSSRELAQEIRSLSVDYESMDFSPELRDLLRSIFKIDPKERASLDQIMTHPWSQGLAFDQTCKFTTTNIFGTVELNLLSGLLESSLSCPKDFPQAQRSKLSWLKAYSSCAKLHGWRSEGNKDDRNVETSNVSNPGRQDDGDEWYPDSLYEETRSSPPESRRRQAIRLLEKGRAGLRRVAEIGHRVRNGKSRRFRL